MDNKPGYRVLERRIHELIKAQTGFQAGHEALQKKLLHLKSLIDESLDGMVLFGPDKKVIEVNKRFAGMLGYTCEEMSGMYAWDWDSLMHEEEILRRFSDLGRTKMIFETQHRRKDGTMYPAEVALSGTTIEGETLILSIARDITARKKSQEDRLLAQKIAKENEKYALVGQVAGNMAHDFNNLLTIIMGNSELALAIAPEGPVKDALQLIFDQSKRGKKLTRNLVAFASEPAFVQTCFQLNDIFDLVLGLLNKEMRLIRVTTQWDRHLPDISGDADIIENCVINLLQNAIHATGKKRNPQVFLRTFERAGQVVAQIDDNGCGIPYEFAGRVFEPAFTLKGSWDKTGAYHPGVKGSGYGLANVKKFVEQHHGSVTLSSIPEHGTRVTLSFPACQGRDGQERSQREKVLLPAQGQKSLAKKRVLLVEDEPAISHALFRVLTGGPCYHRVDIAASGTAAIEFFEKNTYDFISLDYVLSGQNSGADVYQHIREKNKYVPILFVSGHLRFIDSIRCLKENDPHLDHLSKPCGHSDYLSKINHLLSA